MQILFFNAIPFTATTDFMYSLWGLLGCSMDFVTPHYQFCSIEFYEPNTALQEAHIKMLACFLHQIWPSSCFHLLNCLHLLFPCQNLLPDLDLFLVSFPLLVDDDTTLRLGGDGTPLLAVNQSLIHTSQIVPLYYYRPLFGCPSCHNKSLRGGCRMTSPWTGYSQLDKSIPYIVCRNRFSSVWVLEKRWNFAIKY